MTVRVSGPIGTIDNASNAIHAAIDDGSMQRLIREINPDSTMTVLGVVTGRTTTTTTPTPSPLRPQPTPEEFAEGTATPTATPTANDTANSDPFIHGGSDPSGISNVAKGALVALGTAVSLIACAVVVCMVRQWYRPKEDREPPSTIHIGRGVSLSGDNEEMYLSDIDVEMGGDDSVVRARRRQREQQQQQQQQQRRANQYHRVSSGSDSFLDPLDPNLYATARTANPGEMNPGRNGLESGSIPWHNDKATDTDTASESTTLYVDSSLDASRRKENAYDKSMAVGVAVGVIAGARIKQWEDTGDPLGTSDMERNGDVPKERVLASKTAQFSTTANHSNGRDLLTDSPDVWTQRNLDPPEHLVQASETAQFDPTADHTRDVVPMELAGAIAVSNGLTSEGNSDSSTDSSFDEESSSAGDSTSSSSSSGSSSTEDLATGITNYDPKTAEIAIASATMIGVVVGLSRQEDERYDSNSIESDDWGSFEAKPKATLIKSIADNSCNVSASKSIPESTRSPYQQPMLELSPAEAAAEVPPQSSFSDTESSYDDAHASEDEESIADIIKSSKVETVSPVPDVDAINTMHALRRGELPKDQGIRESSAAEREAMASSERQVSSLDQEAYMAGETSPDDAVFSLAGPAVAWPTFTDDASSKSASEWAFSSVNADPNPVPGAVIAATGIVGDLPLTYSDSEGSSRPSATSPAAAAAIAKTPFSDDATSNSDSSGALDGIFLSANADAHPQPGAVITSTGIVGDLPWTNSDSEGSSGPSTTSTAEAASVAGTLFSDDVSSNSDSSSPSEDSNPLPGAAITSTGIVGGMPWTNSGSEGSSGPPTTNRAAGAAVAENFCSSSVATSSESSSASEGDYSSASTDPNPQPGAVMTSTGIVGDLPWTNSDSDGSAGPFATSPTGAAAVAGTSFWDDASSSSDSSSASEGVSSIVSADPSLLPGGAIATTGIVGDSPSPDSDSDDMHSHGSDSEFAPAPFPHNDFVSDFNSRQVDAGSTMPESLGVSLIDLNGRQDLSRAPLPIEDSILDLTTRQSLHASSEIMFAPMPEPDSFSDLQTRQPSSTHSRASAQHSVAAVPFEESGEGSNTSFITDSGSNLQDTFCQSDSSLVRFQQRRSHRLSAFSTSMRANSTARRKTTVDPALTRSYDRNDLRSSMPPPKLSGLLDVRMRSLREHIEQDDKSDSSYFDSMVGSTNDVDTTDKEKTAAIQGALQVAAFESAMGRVSMKTDGAVADDAAVADLNRLEGGRATEDDWQATPLPNQRLAEEVIGGLIADTFASEHYRSDERLVWALSRSLSRLAAADRMGELSLPPGIVHGSSSSSDGGDPTNNDL